MNELVTMMIASLANERERVPNLEVDGVYTYVGFPFNPGDKTNASTWHVCRITLVDGAATIKGVSEKYEFSWDERKTLAYDALDDMALDTMEVYSSAVAGEKVATITSIGGGGPYTYSITLDVGDYFQLSGDELQIKNPIPVTTIASVTIKSVDARNTEYEETFNITSIYDFLDTYALEMNAVDQFINFGLPDAIANLTNDFTYSFWIKPTNLGNQGILSRYVALETIFYVRVYSRYLDVRFNCPSGGYSKKQVSTKLVDTERSLVTITWLDGELTIYVNDVVPTVVSSGIPENTIKTGTTQLLLGNYLGTTFSNSLINQLTIWDKALSVAEVLELYNSGNTLNCETHSASANLILYAPFDCDPAISPVIKNKSGDWDGELINPSIDPLDDFSTDLT